LALSPPRLLAYRALGLGDLLTAVPALRALARAFPDHLRVLATPTALAGLARLAGAVDEVLDTPFETLPDLPPSACGADVAVNLHGRGPRSTALLAESRPGRLIAFGLDGIEWRDDEHEVARWCRLLAESGIPADPADLDLPAPSDRRPPSVTRGATVIHPGASSVDRQWGAARWAAVAREVGPVVITGGPSEVALAREVAARAGVPAERVLAGRTDVLDLAAVVAASSRVLSGDTGVAHLATALRRPSVVLFGPVRPEVWGPPPDRPWHVPLWRGGRIDAIAVDDVLAALPS
jgi:ADP-heptose:LPS heptosyltransferase